MNKYNIFLSFFILSILALIAFLVFYLGVIFNFAMHSRNFSDSDPFEVIATIFNPSVIMSGIVLAITSLIYRVLGIVHVARSKSVSDGEKALWVIGFLLMGFITAIVFLVMAKGKKFVE